MNEENDCDDDMVDGDGAENSENNEKSGKCSDELIRVAKRIRDGAVYIDCDAIETPQLFSGELKGYQLEGLKWFAAPLFT